MHTTDVARSLPVDPFELLDRESELTAVDAALESAVAGRGSVLVIDGPAGIGKTRLLLAARERAQRLGMQALSARASELETEFGFGLVRQLFESAGVLRGELFSGAATHAAGPLGRGGGATSAPADPDSLAASMHGLYWLAVNLGAESPLLLAVDDLHWSDLPSLRWLAYLARRLEGLPIALVVAHRSGDAGPPSPVLDALTLDPLATRLEPQPLSPAALERAVAGSLGERPDPSFRDACHAATGGNPFLMRELVNELAARSVAPTAAAARLVPQLEPSTIARATQSRLAGLSPAAPALARAVAVLGSGATPHHAAVVSRLGAAEVATAAEALASADILEVGSRLGFVHPIVRSVVYAEIPPLARSQLHTRAAEVLTAEGADPGRIASHLLATAPAGNAEVVEGLRAAARSALARGAPEPATAYLVRATEESPDRAVRAAVLHELGAARALMYDPGAFGDLSRALEELSDPRERARAAAALWPVAIVMGRTAEFFGVVERAAAEAEAFDRELALRLDAQLALARWVDRSLRPQVARRLAARAGLRGETPGEKCVLVALEYERAMEGAPGDPATRPQAAMEIFDVLDPEIVWIAINTLVLADRLEEARSLYGEAQARARRRGSPAGFMISSLFRGTACERLGELDEAEADNRAALDLAVELGWQFGIPEAAAFLVDTLLERGDLGGAQETLTRHGLDGELDDTFAAIFAVFARGRLLRAQRRPAEALAALLDCGARLERWGVSNPSVVAWRSAAAGVLHQLGEHERALALADEEVELAHRCGAPRALGQALGARALLDGGDARIAGLRAAAEVLERSPARIAHAHALNDLGAALRVSGEPMAAREPLARALEIAHLTGARPAAERARQELLAAGARPRRPVSSGVEGLTASERRVATIAAGGLTNAEVAQELFITAKTVEAHLGRAYRKLGIAGRAQLPAALGLD